MIKRPSKLDSEKEVLEMQQKFFDEKEKDSSFQPAAKAVKLEKKPDEKNELESEGKSIKESEFAKRRRLKRQLEEQQSSQNTLPAVPPKETSIMIGDIVERTYNSTQLMQTECEYDNDSFPKVEKLNLNELAGSAKSSGSLFSQMFANKSIIDSPIVERMQVDTPPPSSSRHQDIRSNDFHEENMQTLSQLTKEEILEEQQKLLQSLDPKLIAFLKSKKTAPASKAETLQRVQETLKANAAEPKEAEKLPVLDVLQEAGSENWLHFDVVESEKLEWTKDVEAKMKTLKPGEQFEARFDWKGILLPFEDTTVTEGNRDLYLHGEEPTRPGYTLQELFRLARSNILQQRITALTSIAGVLNIYNQGFYDGILELPLSKIFFFLRFALDENTPAIVEATAKALAFLFYNDTDEILCDVLYETALGVYQPALEKQKASTNFVLDEAFSDISLEGGGPPRATAKPAYASNLDDDELENKDAMTDFHMAEADLVECLLRTNILERIRYILFTMHPEEAVVVTLVKVLIRLARTNKETAMKILMVSGLVDNVIAEFLVPIESSEAHRYEPQYLVLKLFRVIASYDIGMMLKLQNMGVLDAVEKYVFTRRDVTMKMIQLQIEALRFLRLRFHYLQDDALYGELLPALRYMLEWHYQYLKFEADGPFVLRTHASAVIALLGAGKISLAMPMFSDIMMMCLSKWFSSAAKSGLHEFSQKILISICLDTTIKFLQYQPTVFHSFVDNYLKPFLMDSEFTKISADLCLSSPFKKTYSDRSAVHQPLPNMGAVVVLNVKSSPSLIFVKQYPTILLQSLLNFIGQLNNNNAANVARYNELVPLFFNRHVLAYVNSIGTDGINANVKNNWFTKLELKFLLSVVRWEPTVRHIDPTVILKVSFKLLNCLCQDMINDIIYVFDNIVFNTNYYKHVDSGVEEFKKYRNIYAGYFLAPLIKSQSVTKSFFTSDWKQTCMERCWPYGLLNILLNNFENLQAPDAQNKDIPEDDIIITALQFTELLENNSIHLTTPTESLIYIMMAYLGPNTKFLEPRIKAVIERRVRTLKSKIGDRKFNLNIKLDEGKKSFESFYSLFLDQFQSSSYGDDLFGVLVMVPMAQKYDVKWRAKVWSEFVAVVRFLTCPEDQVFGQIEDYLQPAEAEESVIKSYMLALSSNLVREGSLPHRIASHHVLKFKEKYHKLSEP